MNDQNAGTQPEFLANGPDWDELGIDPNEEVGAESYVPQSQYPPPAPIATYDFQGVADSLKWGRDNNMNLYCRGQVKIVGGEFDGKKADAFISNRLSSFREDGTDMEDFARALGAEPENGSRFTNAELARIITDTWTQIRKGYQTWEGYCSECKQTVARGKKGAQKADKNGFKAVGFQKGQVMVSVVACPICGRPVEARGKFTKFYMS